MIYTTDIIYLDGASNTPVSAEVFHDMKPFLTDGFVGNSMATHDYGIYSGERIESARRQLASDLHVKDNEIFFTSGATEGNNWVIKSYAIRYLLKHETQRNTILCCATEHASVLNCCKQVAEWGMNVEYVPVGPSGSVTLEDVVPYLSSSVALICVMAVNNETGAINDVGAITNAAKELGIATLVDCTQALSCGGEYVEIGKRFPAATFMTFSAHKIYGPTGCGCLIARESLEPLIIGGAQEHGLRGGTMNVAGIVGMESAVREMHNAFYEPWFQYLKSYLVAKLNETLPKARLNVESGHPSIVSLNLSEYLSDDFDQLASALNSRYFAVSAGSACDANHDETAGDFNGSHVLLALGLTEHEIRCTVRISFTKTTLRSDIDALVWALEGVCRWDRAEEAILP